MSVFISGGAVEDPTEEVGRVAYEDAPISGREWGPLLDVAGYRATLNAL